MKSGVRISAPAWGKDLKKYRYLEKEKKKFLDNLVQNPKNLNRIKTLYDDKRLTPYEIFLFVRQAVSILDEILTLEKIKKKILFGGQILEIKRLFKYLDDLKVGVTIGDYELEKLENFGAMYGD